MSETIAFFGNAYLSGPSTISLIRRDWTPADATFGVPSGQAVQALRVVVADRVVDVAVYADGSEEAAYGLLRAGVAVRNLFSDAGVALTHIGLVGRFSVI